MNLPGAFFLVAFAIIWNFGLIQAEGGVGGDSSAFSETLGRSTSSHLYRIEGKVIPPPEKGRGTNNNEWLLSTQVLLDGGDHVGLLREDGSFTIEGVSPGSHVVEVIHPRFQYETARVDISTKGKVRARKNNYIQPSAGIHMLYPLKLAPLGPYKYFVPREEWKLTDVLLNPTVLMMVLPLVLVVILPKIMSDPETRKEMEAMQMPKYEMPEMSEMLTSFFGGGGDQDDNKKGQKAIKSKKNN